MPAIGSWSGTFTLRKIRGQQGTFLYIPDPLDPLAFTRPNGQTILLDHPFETDGATTPRFLRCIRWLDPWASWAEAALLHDWLFDQRYTGTLLAGFFAANRILREGAVALGLSRWKAWIVHRAIDCFAWYFWMQGEHGKYGQVKRPVGE